MLILILYLHPQVRQLAEQREADDAAFRAVARSSGSFYSKGFPYSCSEGFPYNYIDRDFFVVRGFSQF